MEHRTWLTLLNFLQNADEAVAEDFDELEQAKNSPIFDEDCWPTPTK